MSILLQKLAAEEQFSHLTAVAKSLQSVLREPHRPQPANTASLQEIISASRQLRRNDVWVVRQGGLSWRLVAGDVVITTSLTGSLRVNDRLLPTSPPALASLPPGRVFLGVAMLSPPSTPRERERPLRPASPEGLSSDAEARLSCDAEAPENALISFRCPITLQLLIDPVVASDGHTYERSAIVRWLARPGPGIQRSPCTNMPLASDTLTANHALKSAIMEWREQRR